MARVRITTVAEYDLDDREQALIDAGEYGNTITSLQDLVDDEVRTCQADPVFLAELLDSDRVEVSIDGEVLPELETDPDDLPVTDAYVGHHQPDMYIDPTVPDVGGRDLRYSWVPSTDEGWPL